MNKWNLCAGCCGLLAVLCAVAPRTTSAAGIDGSAPILCSVGTVSECDRWGVCSPVEPEEVGLPPFVRIDAAKKAMEATDGSDRKTKIARVANENGRLLLQGGENGRAWSVVIGHDGGDMTAAVADDDGGFMVSGNCTLP
jgi:hypothetical protein